jgi:omega-6 fatty acid desaturase (delta-12 desaturase)
MLVPAAIGSWMHHIMEHPAHHLSSRIPLYHLKAAQRHLSEAGAPFRRVPFTLAHYLRCVRTCKLHDYTAQSWIRFPRA